MVELILLAFATGGGLMVALGWRQRSELARAWVAAAEQCRLEGATLRRRAGWVTSLDARRGPLFVELAIVRPKDLVQPATRIAIHGLPPDFELRREDPDDALTPMRRRGRVPVGDDRFDVNISIEGERLRALALLDATTRERARAVFFGGQPRSERVYHGLEKRKLHVGLSRGRLVVERYAGYSPQVLAQSLAEALTFAEGLLVEGPLEARLAANVRGDPEPRVRLNNLRELLAVSPRHPATREALEAALADGDEQVQLEAAIALGSEGRATLLDIASRGWSADACSARAVQELRSALPVEQARAILAHALRTRLLETAAACVESLSRRGPEDADTFARVLALEHGGLAAAAARALGRVGGVSAVATLVEAQRRLSGDEEFRRAAREAIAAIQSRTSGALPGQLSLAGDQAGQVSLSRDETGRVSLDDAKR